MKSTAKMGVSESVSLSPETTLLVRTALHSKCGWAEPDGTHGASSDEFSDTKLQTKVGRAGTEAPWFGRSERISKAGKDQATRDGLRSS